MRRILTALCLTALALVWGCSTEQATNPELSHPDASVATGAAVVTLDDLKTGFGNEAALSGPDVAVLEFTVSSNVVLPGDVLTMQARVTNIGNSAAVGPFDVWIGVLDTGFEFARVTIDRLAAGESRSGVVNFTVPVADFAKAYPAGSYTLYCTHDFGDNNPTNNFMTQDVALRDYLPGNIQISVNPVGLEAPWTLDGPSGIHFTGTGSGLYTDLEPGDYTITWGDVPGYVTPAPETATLQQQETLDFTGTYVFVGVPDTMKMYFADWTACTTAGFLDHLTAYIVYENPSLTSVRGFECGYDVILPGAKGAQINTSITASFPVPSTDVGVDNSTAGTYNRIVGYSDPLPVSGNTVLATLDIFILDSGEIDISLRPADPQSPPLDGNPKVVKDDFNLFSVPVGYAPGSPALIINGGDPCGVVPGK